MTDSFWEKTLERLEAMSDFEMHGCPVCGRTLTIPSDWLGGEVRCGHCTAKFVVPVPAPFSTASTAPACTILEHADALLRATQYVLTRYTPAEAA